MKKLFIIPAAVLAVSMGGAFAQTATAPTFVAKQNAGERLTSEIVGLDVTNTANEKLGDVNYLVMNDGRTITTVVIGVGGFLGVGEKNVAVPYEALTMSTDANGKNKLVLNATKDALQAAPKYETLVPSLTERVKEGAKEAYDATKQKAGEAYDATKQKAGEAYDATKQKAGEAADATKNAAKNAADATTEAAKNATDATRDAAGNAANATRDAARDAGNAMDRATTPAPAPVR